ncbi:Phage-like element PBSX protein, XkdF [uncultured Caudovirales phage]|uniref:Phage-like element PBSX protein, XkdF n=1 Tax=uncultured Caudovirales phage TaxID=2100421 RepID=A0A6J5MY02_9CAUD|nr:Phage-like element PBSX protein, XkdF [uncultured Caudovirales phage]
METYTVIFKKDETEGVFGISLVESPAMESNFIALSEQKEIQLKAIDNEKRILLGAVLIPNKPIYRNQNGKEFNIVFPAETIRLSMENFFEQGYQSASTLEHDNKQKLKDVTFVESWIKEDEVNDKSVKYGMNEPVGTWFAAMKVNNDEIWNDFVKTGKVKGFSIDGFFDLERINLKTENMNVDLILSAIKDGFASLIKKEEIVLGSVMTQDQSLTIDFEGDTLAVGLPLTIQNENGDIMPLPDGEYILENGMVLTVAGGLVSELSEGEAEAAEEAKTEIPAEMEKESPSVVKSEKHTQEIFYQLAQEFGKQLETLKAELKADFEAKIEEQKEIISLTKNKPAKEKSFEEMTALERFRLTKNK